MAYWRVSGAGTGAVTTGVLAAPTDVTVPSINGSTVPVSWTRSLGADGYFVTRDAGSGRVAACGTSLASLDTAASCTDSGPGDGTYTYRVTAVSRSWTATSAPSGSVAVTTTQAFTTQPGETSVGAAMTPPVKITTTPGAGAPVVGAAITVSIGANPSGGTLTGTTTAVTDAAGVATFNDLSIDKAGPGYTLAATSAGLAPTTSAAFAVVLGPALRAAGTFSVLAGTGVVSTGATAVSGDLGVSPSSSVTGFPQGIVAGAIDAGDAAAAQGQSDLAVAYSDVVARTASAGLEGDLGGRTVDPGVYHSVAALAVTGTVTLDAQGDPDALFIFQVGAALNTAALSAVTLINGAQASHVFWQVLGAAGTGAGASFSGTIMASGAITLGAGTTLIGRALSRGTVTLAASTIRFTNAQPPTVTIVGGVTDVTKDTTPTITGTADVAAGTTVTVTVAAALGVPPVSVATQTLSTTVQTGNTWSVTAADLPAWQYGVQAKVRDPAGNGGMASQNLTVEVSPPTVGLGSAAVYSVLGTGVASTGATTISGDLGVSPGTSVTGFPQGVAAGTIHAGDAVAAQAQTDLTAALVDATARERHTDFTGDLGGRTFHAGVHRTGAALAVTGTVTLDAQGDPDAVFIFQVGAALNTAALSAVDLVNGAQASHVFWQVLGAAGTGAGSWFAGTILASGPVTLGAGTTLIGRALSCDAVTLAASTIRFTDAPAPAITIDGGDTVVTKNTTPTITGTTSAAVGTTVTVSVAGQMLSTTVHTGGVWAVTAAVLTAGQHGVQAKVRDAAGNGATASQSLTIEVSPPTVGLGSAASYSVLGASVVSTGATMLGGDLGVSLSTSVTGFPPGGVTGVRHAGDPAAAQAQSDLAAAIDDATARTPYTVLPGELGGLTFHGGVYRTGAALAVTGTVTLDAQGDPDAVFIFQVGAALNTAAASSVTLANGAQASHVFWQVLGAAGTGAGTSFSGTIMASGPITLGAGTTLIGRALSRDTVTLSGNAITQAHP